MSRYILLLFFLAMSGQMNAQISASETTGCAPLNAVQFSTTFTNPLAINWDFDDGGSSQLPSPQHTFVLPGTYEVTFSATVNGTPVNESILITVFGNPTANFEVGNGCLGSPVQFSDLSEGGGGVSIVGWEWTFGEGGFNNTSQNPSYSYPFIGVFDVGLIVTDANGCTDALVLQDATIISTQPSGTIQSSPSSLISCEPPFTVDFSTNASSNSPATDVLTYDWDFGNGETSTEENPGPVTYTEIGTYQVSLTVTDDAGCTRTVTRTVVVDVPNAEFTIEGADDGVVCEDIVIENLSDVPAVFDYGDGQSGTQTAHSYNSSGTYMVTMTIGSGTCTDTDSLEVEVEIPEFELITDPSLVCSIPAEINISLEGNALVDSVTWTFNQFITDITSNGNTGVATVFYEDTITYQINGNLPLNISGEIVTTNGCRTTVSIVDTLWQPNALTIPNITEGCAPLNVLFSDSSTFFENQPLILWEWHINGEVISSNESTDIEYLFEEPGEYDAFLIVTNSAGCVDTSWTPTIYVGETLDLDFSFDPQPVCVGQEVSFTDLTNNSLIDFYHYDTDASRLSGCFLNGDQSWIFDNVTGTQTVTLTAVYNGCSSTFEQDIEVGGAIGRISYQCNCETPLDYTFDAEIQNGSTWDWDFGDGTVIAGSNELQSMNSYSGTGDYSSVLTVYSDDGCPPFTDTLDVKVRQLQAILTTTDSILCIDDEFSTSGALSIDNEIYCATGYTIFWGDDTPPTMNTNGAFEHAYEESGVFDVAMTVEDINGCRDTAVVSIKVFGFNIEAAVDIATGCLPLDVNFNSTYSADTTIVSIGWDFDDGTTSIEEDPAHQYDFPVNGPLSNPQPWQATFTVTDVLGCSASASVDVLPIVPIITIASVSDNTLCVGDDVIFTPSPNTPLWTYNWDFGFDSSVLNQPSVTYSEAGSYNASLSIIDENGCPGEVTVNNIVIVQNYPEAIISSTADEQDVLCYPLQATFTNASDYFGANPGALSWSLGNGSQVAPNNVVATTYDSPGTYVATLEVSSSHGCSDQTEVSLEVVGPVANLSLDPNTICKGETIDFAMTDTSDVWVWEWDFGDGTVQSGDLEVSHQYDFHPPSGQTVASLTVWSLDSVCSFSYVEDVFIHQVIADFDRNGESLVTDSIHCDDLTDLLTNTSIDADTYSWDFGNGNFSSQENPPVIDYSPGTYNITLAVSNVELGCVDTITKTIVIYPLPNPTAQGGFICRGDTLQLFATGGESYTWTPPDNLSSQFSQNPLAWPALSSAYNVLVTDTNLCSQTAIAEVEVFQPLPEFELDSTIIIGETIQVILPPGLGGYTYEWTPETWVSCTTCPDPLLNPEEDIVYAIVVSDTLGCFSTLYRVDIEVLPLSSVAVPDAFTPNGDGINDIVYVEGWGIKDLLTFEIYNRWGEQVFKTSNIEEGWDGRYKGEIQNMDTYTYIVQVETYVDDSPLELKGYLLLKR